MHHGYSVVEVETAEAMLEQVDVVQPSLIILDIRLPGIDGCKGLQKLRAAGHTMPVFIFSEFYDLVRDEIEACQPDAFFPKSKGPNEMIRAIATKLATQPAK
jgi:DNA-binding response OmpR family regulator